MNTDASNDPLARAGEGQTVVVIKRRCRKCGGRIEQIVDGYTREVIAERCRGCGRSHHECRS
jgi:hypothetical protein